MNRYCVGWKNRAFSGELHVDGEDAQTVLENFEKMHTGSEVLWVKLAVEVDETKLEQMK